MGRPSPEEEERLERLKVARNIRAGDLGLDRGRVFSNAALLDVARAMPSSLEELMALGSARRWQVEEVGPALLESLRPPQPLP